jgi:uncharacterized protein YjiS (DUF1127 family)
MATTADDRAPGPDHRAAFDGFFASLGQGFNAYLERLSRADQVRRLDAMSDGEHAELGIRRDEIVRFVFRDRLSY